MLIAVKSCEAHWSRCSAIRDTWWTPEVHFFTGTQLDVPDSYAALPRKTKAICQWAVERNIDKMFVCDTDTYLCVPRLTEPPSDYAGYRLEGKNYASGGAGYWLSNRALRLVAAADPSDFANEDEFVGAVMKNAGIPLCHDPRYALYEDVLPDNNIISRHLSSQEPFQIQFMYDAHRKAAGQ